jgi:2-polyprenyl-3-methyl-5-hydroxy-6-metoxy-1,4-benzoquinol methylase
MSARICKLCGAELSSPFLDLGMSPLSNALIEPERLSSRESLYPLQVFHCGVCGLVQVPDVESPDRIFRDYAYFSSYSTTWLEHVARFADAMTERLRLGPSSLVVEIASNDGHLLQRFARKGIRVLGIEPARNVAEVAIAAGIPTITEFLTTALARRSREQGMAADLLVGNNVLAHVPALDDFVEALAQLLAPAGTLTLEFPHLMRMLERNEFDTIYHEHYSYFSLLTAKRALKAHGLDVFDVEELPTHGGSLRVYAAHEGTQAIQRSVLELVDRELAAGVQQPATYARFAERAAQSRDALLRFLHEARSSGRSVLGYGAPAKATTLLNYCGVGTDLVRFTVDRSPYKQGKFIPGARIPIEPPERIFESKPDYVMIFPWNIKEEVMEQMSGVREWGGRFVVPIPSVAVLP